MVENCDQVTLLPRSTRWSHLGKPANTSISLISMKVRQHRCLGIRAPAGAQVFTSRTDNVGHHRAIQARVAAAVSRALHLAHRMAATAAAAAPSPIFPAQVAASASTLGPGSLPPPPLEAEIDAAEVHAFSLPLAAALTTGGGGRGRAREGLLLQLRWRSRTASGTVASEISPLPGNALSRSSLPRACGLLPPLKRLQVWTAGSSRLGDGGLQTY